MARRKKSKAWLWWIGGGVGAVYLIGAYAQKEAINGGMDIPKDIHLIVNPFLWGYDGPTKPNNTSPENPYSG